MRKILLLLSVLIASLAVQAQELVVSIGTYGNMTASCTQYNAQSTIGGMLKNAEDPGRTWSTSGFSNNGKQWTFLACGTKTKTAYEAVPTPYVSTDFAFTEAISKVEVKLTRRNNGANDLINEAYLEVADNADMTGATRYDIDITAFNTAAKNSQATYSVEIPTPVGGMYYRVNFDYKKPCTNNGFLEFDEISYYGAKEEGAVTAPSINQLDDNMVELMAEEGTTIYYTTDETEPTKASTLYSAPFEITGTTVVKAVAYNGDGKASPVATKTVKPNTFTSIADFVTAAPGTEAKLNTPLTAIYKNGTNLYVTDNKGGYMLVYNASGISGDFPNGTVISYVKGTYNVSYKEIVVTSFGETSTGTEVEPETYPIEEIASDMLYQYVKIEDVNIVAAATANNYTATDETGSVVLYNTFYNASKFDPVIEVPEGNGFTVYGFVGLYNTTIQITPIAFEGGDEKEHVATPTFDPESGSKLMVGEEITISCATPGATIYYTTDNMTPSTLYTGPIEFTGAVTIRAYATANGYFDSEIASATYEVYVEGENDVTFDFTDAAKVNTMYTGEETLTTPTGATYNADATKSTCISLTDKSFVNDVITVSFSNGTNNNNPPVWCLFSTNQKLECRLYTGEYFTVKTNQDGYKITRIEIGQNTSSTNWSEPTITANAELPDTQSEFWANKTFNAPTDELVTDVKFSFTGTSRLATIAVTYVEDENAVTAIDEIAIDQANGPVEYYNLQGIRVNGDNLPAGIYLRRQGTTTTKVLVK